MLDQKRRSLTILDQKQFKLVDEIDQKQVNMIWPESIGQLLLYTHGTSCWFRQKV